MEAISDNLNVISAVFNFVGTIVIVWSLLYLAKQNRLTNKIAQGETERELYDSYNELLSRYADPENIELQHKGLQDFQSLTNIEKTQFMILFLVPHINNCESFYQLYKKNLISQERLRPIINIVVAILKTNGGREAWKDLQNALNPEFTALLNRELVESDVPPINKAFDWMNPQNIEKKE